MKIVLSSTVALSAVCAIATLSGGDQPKFEVASVKKVGRGMIHNSLDPGSVTLKGDPLKLVLMEAFSVKTYEIVGPSWLDEDCFDIVAKMPKGATKDQIPAMLQSLLVERFKLAAHKEDRPRPVYAMVVDKGGPKFKEANLNFRRTGPRSGEMTFRASPDTAGFKGAMTMAKLAHFLSGRLDRPVQDFTRLTGTYDIDLSWSPDPSIDRQSPAAAFGDTRADVATDPTATLFTAMRDLLGLKLERRNEPVEMLVIDHVERVPSEN